MNLKSGRTVTEASFGKRKHVLILTALIMLFILSFLPAAYAVVIGFDPQYAEETYTPLDGTLILFEKSVSRENMYSATTAWLLIPENLRKSLVEYSCMIYISDSAGSSDGTTVGQAHISHVKHTASSGIITWSTKESWIVCRTASRDLTGTVLHEIGHILDETIAFDALGDGTCISESAAWEAFFLTYAEELAAIDSYTHSNMYNPSEAFAECFRLVFENPQALIDVSPGICEYVMSVIETFCASSE